MKTRFIALQASFSQATFMCTVWVLTMCVLKIGLRRLQISSSSSSSSSTVCATPTRRFEMNIWYPAKKMNSWALSLWLFFVYPLIPIGFWANVHRFRFFFIFFFYFRWRIFIFVFFMNVYTLNAIEWVCYHLYDGTSKIAPAAESWLYHQNIFESHRTYYYLCDLWIQIFVCVCVEWYGFVFILFKLRFFEVCHVSVSLNWNIALTELSSRTISLSISHSLSLPFAVCDKVHKDK